MTFLFISLFLYIYGFACFVIYFYYFFYVTRTLSHTIVYCTPLYRPSEYERVYLPLYKMADTSFQIQGDDTCMDSSDLWIWDRTGNYTKEMYQTQYFFRYVYTTQCDLTPQCNCTHYCTPSCTFLAWMSTFHYAWEGHSLIWTWSCIIYSSLVINNN